jgi:hypothetical protein
MPEVENTLEKELQDKRVFTNAEIKQIHEDLSNNL